MLPPTLYSVIDYIYILKPPIIGVLLRYLEVGTLLISVSMKFAILQLTAQLAVQTLWRAVMDNIR